MRIQEIWMDDRLDFGSDRSEIEEEEKSDHFYSKRIVIIFSHSPFILKLGQLVTETGINVCGMPTVCFTAVPPTPCVCVPASLTALP